MDTANQTFERSATFREVELFSQFHGALLANICDDFGIDENDIERWMEESEELTDILINSDRNDIWSHLEDGRITWTITYGDGVWLDVIAFFERCKNDGLRFVDSKELDSFQLQSQTWRNTTTLDFEISSDIPDEVSFT